MTRLGMCSGAVLVIQILFQCCFPQHQQCIPFLGALLLGKGLNTWPLCIPLVLLVTDFLFPAWEGLILLIYSLCWSYSVLLIATLIFALVLPRAYKYISWATLAHTAQGEAVRSVDLKRSEMIILVNFSRFLFHTSSTQNSIPKMSSVYDTLLLLAINAVCCSLRILVA